MFLVYDDEIVMKHVLSVGAQEEISISMDAVPNVAWWCFCVVQPHWKLSADRNRCINTHPEAQTRTYLQTLITPQSHIGHLQTWKQHSFLVRSIIQ